FRWKSNVGRAPFCYTSEQVLCFRWHGWCCGRRLSNGRAAADRSVLRQRFHTLWWPRLFSICSFTDRKSTRLNSSHVSISYAVFLLLFSSFPTRRSSDLFRWKSNVGRAPFCYTSEQVLCFRWHGWCCGRRLSNGRAAADRSVLRQRFHTLWWPRLFSICSF